MPTELHYREVERAMEELPVAIGNLIDREQRAWLASVHGGLPTILRSTVLVAASTWRSVKRLTLDRRDAESPPGDLSVAVPPLARTFLDSLISVVFLFDDPTDRAEWFLRSGWRDAAEYQRRLAATHGGDPEWASFIRAHGDWVDSHDADLPIGPAEKADPSVATSAWSKQGTRGWWPNPGKMASLVQDPARKDFIRNLNDRFYGELSADSHLSYMGLVRRAGILSDDHQEQPIEWCRSNVTLTALSLHVALLSEVAYSARLDQPMRRLGSVWQHLRECSQAKELLAARYGTLLGLSTNPGP